MAVRRRSSRRPRAAGSTTAVALAAWLALSASFAGCHARPTAPPSEAPILLYAGTGTSPNDVAAIEDLLRQRRLGHARIDTATLDAMTPEQLAARRLLIVPGGNFVEMGRALGTGTTSRVRDAVKAGLGYLGICAGAFLAGPGTSGGSSPYRAFDLTSGVRFPFHAAEARGVRKAAVTLSRPGASSVETYWEDGPQLGGWGDVVGRYSDGSPAIVEGRVGIGFVVLSGVHPEAPPSWRAGLGFKTPETESHAWFARLVDAALERMPLPHD